MSLWYKISFIFCVVFSGILFFWYRPSKGALQVVKPSVGVKVIIHGTVGSTFNSLNPWECSKDEVNQNTWSARTANKFRNHEYIGYDLIIGKEGFHECIPQELEPWQAAHYLVPAMHDIFQLSGTQKDINKYMIFGWSGLLHYAARKQAGYDLYRHLCACRNEIIKAHGVEPEFTLIAHSHGGNVALWLADAEKELKQKLRIKVLLMFGTPMQKDMAPCIKSPLFESIILCYSDGDSIQTRDYFSSKDGKSYRKMADIVEVCSVDKTEVITRRHDIRCVVNGKPSRVNHTNMWMIGRSVALAKPYDLLPLMVFSPLIIALADRLGESVYADLHIKTTDQTCELTLGRSPCAWRPEQLHESLVRWNSVMHKEWRNQNDKMRHPVFNRKTMGMLYDVFWGE